MKILALEEYKNFTDNEIKDLIKKTELYISELYMKVQDLEEKNTPHSPVSLGMLTVNRSYKADFEIPSRTEILAQKIYDEIDEYKEQASNLKRFYSAREEYNYYKNKDVYKDYDCDECGKYNDLVLSHSGEILEFRGICHYCQAELFLEIKKNLF